MRRQLKKLRQQDLQDIQSSSEDDVKTANKFGQISDESEDESENDEQPVPQKPLEMKKAKVHNEDNFDATIQEFETIELQHAQVVNQSKESVLKRQAQHFDPDYELQKMSRDKRAVAGYEASRNAKKREGRRTLLTPNVQFPTRIDYLLTMEKIPSEDNTALFYFDITKGYRKTQEEFLQCVESADPQSFMDLVNRYPFHVEALYQLALYYHLRADLEQVGKIVSRLLYAFQLAFHHQFSPLSLHVRLDYNMNRFNEIFYKAVFMHIDCVGRKGCYRTALELSKFLLSLSPEEDSMGALFLVEYYSLRSKKYDYFLQFAAELESEFPGGGSMLSYPNVLYSIALVKALKDIREGRTCRCEIGMIEELIDVKSMKELVSLEAGCVLLAALLCFPGVYQRLLKKFAPSEQFEASTECPGGDYTKFADIYAERCHDLWKQEPLCTWLKKAARLSSDAELLRAKLLCLLEPGVRYDRYLSLDKSQFSDDVRNWIPEDINIGVQRQQAPRGNLDPNSSPFWLFLSTLLPWNRVNFAPED